MINIVITGCGCEHEWKEATCTEPKICTVCGEIEGEARGHNWQDATCLYPKMCSECGETVGELGEHSLNEYGVCLVCGEEIGFRLNKSNLKEYIKVQNNIHNPQTIYQGYYAGTLDIEPIKNVKFYNVAMR